MVACDICSRGFGSTASLRQHKKNTGHCVCTLCSKILASLKGLEQHNRNVHVRKCPICPDTLTDQQCLKNHQRSAGHCYCGDCNKTFSSSSGYRAHLQSSLHSTDFRCCDCDRSFRTSNSLDQHLRDFVHSRRRARQPISGIKCPNCSRIFRDALALKNHLSSSVHRSMGHITCIARPCEKKFSSPSALILHLESGACVSGMNRTKLNKMVIACDTENLITKTQSSISDWLQSVNSRLVTQGDDMRKSDRWTQVPPGVLISPQSHSSGIWTPASSRRSSGEWAELVSRTSSSQCPFCFPNKRYFPTMAALKDHINSPAHCEPFIFCPEASVELWKPKKRESCLRQFKTVSGLAQHLESAACQKGNSALWKTVKHMLLQLETSGFDMTRIAQGLLNGVL